MNFDEIRRRLDERDWNTLRFAAFWTFEAVAGIDGKIDRAEEDAFQRFLVEGYRQADPLVKAVLESAQTGGFALRESYLADSRGLDEGLADVAQLLDKVAPKSAAPFKEALCQLAEDVAAASGGFLGFGDKVSKEERHAIAIVRKALGVPKAE